MKAWKWCFFCKVGRVISFFKEASSSGFMSIFGWCNWWCGLVHLDEAEMTLKYHSLGCWLGLPTQTELTLLQLTNYLGWIDWVWLFDCLDLGWKITGRITNNNSQKTMSLGVFFSKNIEPDFFRRIKPCALFLLPRNFWRELFSTKFQWFRIFINDSAIEKSVTNRLWSSPGFRFAPGKVWRKLVKTGSGRYSPEN